MGEGDKVPDDQPPKGGPVAPLVAHCTAGTSHVSSCSIQTLASEHATARATLLATLASVAAHGSPLGPERCIIAAMWEGDVRTALQVLKCFFQEFCHLSHKTVVLASLHNFP